MECWSKVSLAFFCGFKVPVRTTVSILVSSHYRIRTTEKTPSAIIFDRPYLVLTLNNIT